MSAAAAQPVSGRSSVWHPDSLTPDSLAGCYAVTSAAVTDIFGSEFANDTVRFDAGPDSLAQLAMGGRIEGAGRIYPTRVGELFQWDLFARWGPAWYVYDGAVHVRAGALGGWTARLTGTAMALHGHRKLYGDTPTPETAADTGASVRAARVPCPAPVRGAARRGVADDERVRSGSSHPQPSRRGRQVAAPVRGRS